MPMIQFVYLRYYDDSGETYATKLMIEETKDVEHQLSRLIETLRQKGFYGFTEISTSEFLALRFERVSGELVPEGETVQKFLHN